MRLHSLISVFASASILAVGWFQLNKKVQIQPSINDDIVLTPDEINSLPADTIVASLVQTSTSSADSLKYKILRLSLEKSGKPFALGYTSSVTDQQSSVQRIAASIQPSTANPTGITVGLFGVGKALHDQLRPVPIPAVGGLFGLRGMWVNQSHSDRYASVANLEELSEAIAVQGVGWVDVEVLRLAGLATYTTEPSKIWELLNQDRVDYYPRGLPELQGDQQYIRDKYPRVSLEDNLLLAYPLALMFYVNQENEALAAAIELGLKQAWKDGSYLKLIRNSLITPWLSDSIHLQRRRIFSLANPDSMSLLKEVDPNYWLLPWQQLADGELQDGKQLCQIEVFKELCLTP